MAKPIVLPRWATSGGAAVVDPPSGKKDLGWVAAEAPSESYFNWLLKIGYEWDVYLDNFEAEDHGWTGNNNFSGNPVIFNSGLQSNQKGTFDDATNYASEAAAGAALQGGASGNFGVGTRGVANGLNGKGLRGSATGNATVGDGAIGVDAEISGGFTDGFAFRARASGRGWAAKIVTTGDASGGVISEIGEPTTPGDGLSVVDWRNGPTATGTGGGFTGGVSYMNGGKANSNGDTGGDAWFFRGGENGPGVTDWTGGRAFKAFGGNSSVGNDGGDAAEFTGGDTPIGADGGRGALFTGGEGSFGGAGARFVGGVSLASAFGAQHWALEGLGGIFSESVTLLPGLEARGGVAGSLAAKLRIIWNAPGYALEVFREASAGVETPVASNTNTGAVAKLWGPLDLVDSAGSAKLNTGKVLKAWTTIQGNGTGVATQVDAENVSSVTEAADVFTVTFATPMANNGYALTITAGNYGNLISISSKSTTGFVFFVRQLQAGGTQTVPTAADLNGQQFNVHVAGRQ